MTIETQIAALTDATTALLIAVNTKKITLDEAVAYAQTAKIQIELIMDSLAGFDSPAILYASGLTVDDPVQTYEYDGFVYYPKVAELPFTTSGVFETTKFRIANRIPASSITDSTATGRALITAATQAAARSAIDAASVAILAATSGSLGIGTIQAGTGAVARTVESKLRETVSVKDFGAIGDGITDDIAAIQAAIDYAKITVGIKCVEFPTASYATSHEIQIYGGFGDGLTLKGNKSTITCSGNTPVFSLNGSLPTPAPEYRMNVIIQEFTIIGSGKANTGSRAVQMVNGANIQINNCILKNAFKGLYGYGALICNFNQLVIRDNATGVEFLDSVSFAPNDVHFSLVQIIVNDVAIRAINFDYGAWNFHGCEIEGNNLAGNATDGVRVCEFYGAGEVNFFGCHLESNPGQYNIFYDSPGGRHLNIYGSKMIPGDITGYVIYMGVGGGELCVIGSHVTQNVGGNIYLSAGVSAFIIGDTAGNVTGNLSKLVRVLNGQVHIGGGGSGLAGLSSRNSTYGLAAEFEGQVRFVDAANARLGYITETGIVRDAAGGFVIATGTGQVQVNRAGPSFEPGGDNTYELGHPALRWSTVYAGTATINTSDEETKQYIEPIPKAWLDAWAEVEWYRYKLRDSIEEKGEGARWHTGLIAQRVETAFARHGIDAMSIGLLCYNEWDAITKEVPAEIEFVPAITEEKERKSFNGSITYETVVIEPAYYREVNPAYVCVIKEAGSLYGIRYEEALALECALMRDRMAALEGHIHKSTTT